MFSICIGSKLFKNLNQIGDIKSRSWKCY